MRIVSLLPSARGGVWADGARAGLVGRPPECDSAAGVESLPAISSPRLAPRAPGRAIHDRVEELVSRGLSIYELDAERLRELAPDLIVTQTLCEVCAATPADLEAALCAWTGAAPRIVSLAPLSLDDVLRDVTRVAEAIGRAERGAELDAELRARIESLTARGRASSTRPRVAALEWLDPLIAGGNWMPQLIERPGPLPLVGTAGGHSPRLEWDPLEAAEPDGVLIG